MRVGDGARMLLESKPRRLQNRRNGGADNVLTLFVPLRVAVGRNRRQPLAAVFEKGYGEQARALGQVDLCDLNFREWLPVAG
jgi:hypothetical protein